jgi:hypothetical protein
MQERDAEHQARHETDGDLQTGVGEFDENGQPAARQRREKNQHTINRQQPTGRNHAPVIFNLSPECQPETFTWQLVAADISPITFPKMMKTFRECLASQRDI